MRQSWPIIIIVIVVVVVVLSQKKSQMNECHYPGMVCSVGMLVCWNHRMGKDAFDLDRCVSQDTTCSVRQVDAGFPAKRFLPPVHPL